LRLCVHDIRQPIPLGDESFQAIICHQVIEHLTVESATHLLRESFRMLREGGTLLLYSPSCYNRTEALDPCHINLYSPSRLCESVARAGFRIERVSGSPRAVWPGGRAGRVIGNILYSHFRVESLAMSADVIATKPIVTGPAQG
jgi:SAM-dependent methyltransferase